MTGAGVERSGHGETVAVCRLDDLTPERGVAALVRGMQVALFRIDVDGVPRVYAVDHHDPCTGANVLARGLVGSSADGWYVASPLHKQRFDLVTGACLDAAHVRLRIWPVEVVEGVVRIAP